jgi:C1A family cysteine protease
MKFLLIVLLVVLFFANARAINEDTKNYLLRDQWEAFKTKFGKRYATVEEEELRFSIFFRNLEKAAQYNEEHQTDVFGVTRFSDLAEEEFRTQYLNYRPTGRKNIPVKPVESSSTPTNFDWRDQSGVLTAVKDQGQCGSCWAFSATETIESAWALAGNTLTEFAPQQIVSCDTECYGCGGGWTEKAFDYVIGAGGMATESSYPYTSGTNGVTGTCKSYSVAGGSITGYSYAVNPCTSFFCNNQDENGLASALSSVQPMSVCVDASKWSMYTGGVFPTSACSSSYFSQDHCVQLIGYEGYGTSSGYWIVRNSWAESWGEDGMIYLEMGVNACGVANDVVQVSV